MGMEGLQNYEPTPEEELHAKDQRNYSEMTSGWRREAIVEKYGLEKLKGSNLSMDPESRVISGSIDGKDIKVWNGEDGFHAIVDGVEQNADDASSLFFESDEIARYLSRENAIAQDRKEEKGL